MPELHWLSAPGDLSAFRHSIHAEFSAATQAVSQRYPLPAMDVLIQRSAGGTIPELGLLGRTWSPQLFSLYLDPDNPNFMAALEQGAVRRQIIHEIHHCLRMATVGYGTTAGEAMVSEGLAGHFVRYLLNSEPEIWERALPADALQTYALSAALLNTPGYDHARWFFGSGDYPRWFGYSLGYQLVEKWLTVTERSPAARIHVTAAEVIRCALPDIIPVVQ